MSRTEAKQIVKQMEEEQQQQAVKEAQKLNNIHGDVVGKSGVLYQFTAVEGSVVLTRK